ncbi:MAG: hypothetical protein A2X28_05620 [Elusimicrobia bacterium GWA2_56_46]|nr:MAG: hypothetical protein A2X28_05620 [Elusimicrobia bacterium GWA2_56_46]OGR53933.1 MAG: hypothetical protein A2X39_07315 [Elusimicrobia bacterium GWC2_56_31]HBB68081.1 hypothetical protein [Elusimicrobiota bacterium]HBW23219.1 hypothetical protein [Elusimicrobiota bacterium]
MDKKRKRVAIVLRGSLFNCAFNKSYAQSYLQKYLFGDGFFSGELSFYKNSGLEADILEEERCDLAGAEIFSRYDVFDLQLTADIPSYFVLYCLSNGKKVFGWAPRQFFSKQAQSIYLALHPPGRILLPEQILVPDRKALGSAAVRNAVGKFRSEYLIAKSFYSARSRMPDGSDYRIFHRDKIGDFADFASRQDKWFHRDNGLVLSELLQTRDPYLNGSNHVVHKVHLPSGLSARACGKWPLACNRISGQLQLAKARDEVKTIGELFRQHSWEDGCLETYRRELFDLIRIITPLPCLFGADLMISEEGRPFLLELNKIAATFLHIYKNNRPSPLEEYLNAVLSDNYHNGLMIEKLQNYISLASDTESYLKRTVLAGSSGVYVCD